ncbi:hypothetical protein Tco_0004881 [Tanacetum coccineum]
MTSKIAMSQSKHGHEAGLHRSTQWIIGLLMDVGVLPRCPMHCLLLFLGLSHGDHLSEYGNSWGVTFWHSVELRPELPDRNTIIKGSPEGKIGMYTRFIEFANYQIPLSKFRLCVLEYYQIKLSQLFVIGVAKVGHFKIMCRALGRIPTMELEQPFFFIDASVCPLSTSWFSGTSVVKDLLPVDEAVDLPCVELLNENYTLIRKYPETFLCLVGLSRSFIKTDVCPTLLHDNDEEMGLLDFVKSADPFKVKVGERTLAENEGSLITETEDRRKKRVAFVSGSPPVKKAQTEGIVISDSRPSTAEDVTSSYVTPTLERVIEDALHDNVSTRPPSSRFVVLSSGSADTDIPATSQVVSLVSSSQAGVSVLVTESAGDGRPLSAPELETETLSATPSQGSSADDFYESQTVDSTAAMNVYVPNWNVTNNARVDNPIICHSFLDHVTPPGYWAALHNQGGVGFLDAFNINSAQHICMTSELRIHYEYEIMTREKFEQKFTDSAVIVQQRDVEVVELKAKLEKSESEAAEVEELRKHVSDLEAMVAMKVGEAASFTTQNASLLEKVSALELERNGLKGQVVGENKIAPSVECRSALGKVISMGINKGIQQGLEAGVVHGKAGRSLTQIEAYDQEVEGKYVATVSEFEGDGQGNTNATPEFARFQTSLDQVAMPIYSESGETFGFASSHDSSLGVTDYQVSTLVLSGNGRPTNPLPVVQPHDDLFSTSVLDKSGDV